MGQWELDAACRWLGIVELSGYVASRGLTTRVSGQWNVPAVVPSGAPTYSATWTGIDGFNNGSLIQAGTEQDSTTRRRR